jgi:L-2-hydroxycarboxylate dehydrogenase (NAD+)
MPLVPITELRRVSEEVLGACGVPKAHAELIADTIVHAHRSGKGTHGISRLPIYVRKIRQGLMNPETPITLVKDSPVISVIDAHHGFGQVAAMEAMRLCMEKAESLGIGVVGVRHSNNFGVAGYYARAATERGMIGCVLSNSAPAIAPTGGKRPIFGTNPLAIGFPPGSDGIPIILDMATSVAARGKIRLAAKTGEKIPLDWALDSEGKPTDDPIEALKGTMLPIGGPKGYGLSFVIDILAGMFPGAAFAGDVKPLNHPDTLSNYGHLLVAINPGFFVPKDEYTINIDRLHDAIKASGKEEVIYLPGERSCRLGANADDAVNLSESVGEEVGAVASAFGVPTQHLRN